MGIKCNNLIKIAKIFYDICYSCDFCESTLHYDNI
nr:MAG TPA: 50S ribosomal subunit [Caudoviricetes sp.]DAZ45652.1 MAG TPA: 50S ribosomal subunit [Caudoviricetes sp.]